MEARVRLFRSVGQARVTAAMEARATRRVGSLAGHLVSPKELASPEKSAWHTTPCDDGDSLASGALVLHPDVAAALASGTAVVALESTIVSHGMPYPANLHMAREVEAIVKARGAVPATIAIMDGACMVGLGDADLERLAVMGTDALKVSRRDIAVCVATQKTGATTVSATALLAARAGIKVFVTGGIGGVHRGGENSLDVRCVLGVSQILTHGLPPRSCLFEYTASLKGREVHPSQADCLCIQVTNTATQD